MKNLPQVQKYLAAHPPSINNGCSLRRHILSCTVKESLHFLVAFTLSYALMSYMLQRSYYTVIACAISTLMHAHSRKAPKSEINNGCCMRLLRIVVLSRINTHFTNRIYRAWHVANYILLGYSHK
jgi:hypothetical protein